MSAPASTAPDVLGKLATMALHHGSEWEQVHDAVAELIEAAHSYFDAMDGTCDLITRCAVGRRLANALARVQGGAA